MQSSWRRPLTLLNSGLHTHKERRRQRHIHIYRQTHTDRDSRYIQQRDTEAHTCIQRGGKTELTERGEIFKVMFKASLGTRDHVQHTHKHTHSTLYCSFLSLPRDKWPRQELTSGMLLEGQTLGWRSGNFFPQWSTASVSTSDQICISLNVNWLIHFNWYF